MFNWLRNRFTGQRTLRSVPHLRLMAQHATPAYPDLSQTAAQAGVYTQSPWVYVAVSRIAESAALVPLHVYRTVEGKRVRADDHPLEQLLDHPNPHMSRFDLIEQTVGTLELTGNAYWFLAGEGGTPTEIWPLRPDRVAVVPDGNSYVRGYVYTVDGMEMPLEAVEVIHFRRWHPLNDYYGLSALQAASNAVHTDKAMATWNRNTFGTDNGVPAGIVTLPDTITDADYERIKREWKASYGGTQRRTAFLRGSSVTWQSIAHSQTDLDYQRGREANRDEILNIFGVPVGMVSDNTTEANAKVAERTFIERTLYPKLVRLQAVMTAELLPFWERGAVAAFDDIRPTDRRMQIDEMQAALPVMSVNEVRARYYSLPPVRWGEVSTEAIKSAPVPVPADDHSAVLDELRAWEKFTLRRLGREDVRPFTVEQVPDADAVEISARLVTADDADAIKAVFRAVRERYT